MYIRQLYGVCCFERSQLPPQPSLRLLKISASTDSTSADSTNTTWTESNQDMLNDLTGQGETISQFVPLSENLEAATRLLNEVMSPENRTAFLRDGRTSLMQLGVEWKKRTRAVSTRLHGLDPALATAKVQAAESTSEHQQSCPAYRDRSALRRGKVS